MISRLVRSRGIIEAELSITFVGQLLIRRLNREYLGHDRVTDVIAFNLSEPGESPFLGDIYICVPRARQQARWYGSGAEEELARLCAHGTLHLLGFDHEETEQAGQMNELQEECVKIFLEDTRKGPGASRNP